MNIILTDMGINIPLQPVTSDPDMRDYTTLASTLHDEVTHLRGRCVTMTRFVCSQRSQTPTHLNRVVAVCDNFANRLGDDVHPDFGLPLCQHERWEQAENALVTSGVPHDNTLMITLSLDRLN
jgi:hypothetical protein